MEKRNCTILVAKTKALISCAVTAQLICGFVFAYADFWFSDAAAQLSYIVCMFVSHNLFSFSPKRHKLKVYFVLQGSVCS